MLVFSRRVGERIVLPESQTAITVVSVGNNVVRLGIAPPDDVTITRVRQRKQDRSRVSEAECPFHSMAPIPIRVLVADADQAVRRGYQDLSHSGDLDVRIVPDATNCVNELIGFRPHLLLLDCELPAGRLAGKPAGLRQERNPLQHGNQEWSNCAGILMAMRERADVPVTPVIITSALPRKPEDDMALPIIDCIQKPITTRQLKQGISALFAYRGWRSQLTEEQRTDVESTFATFL